MRSRALAKGEGRRLPVLQRGEQAWRSLVCSVDSFLKVTHATRSLDADCWPDGAGWHQALGNSATISRRERHEILPEDGMLSQQQRYIYSMEIMEMLCCSYIAEQGGVSEDKLSEDLKLPIRTVRKLLFDLANGKLVAEIAPDQTTGNHLYQPAIPVNAVTPARIIATLEDLGRYDSLIPPDNKYVIFLEKMRKQLADSDANKPLCSLNNGGKK